MWVILTDDGTPRWFAPTAVAGAVWFDGVSEEILLTCRLLENQWVPRVVAIPIAPTAEDLAEQETAKHTEQLLAEVRQSKLTGISFEGVMCSATSQDQAGLMAVLTGIQLQGAGFTATRFEFENGTSLVIHLGNYRDFIARWLPFRQTFFRAN